jgi:hypothetical protein
LLLGLALKFRVDLARQRVGALFLFCLLCLAWQAAEATSTITKPNFGLLLDMAQVSNLCDTSPFILKRSLSISSVKRDDIYVLCRELPELGIRYNYIEYTDVVSAERRRVISVRGTKNLLNVRTNANALLTEVPGVKGIKAHRGYVNAALALFDDFHVKKCGGAALLQGQSQSNTLPLHLTGHSSGGCVVTILALMLLEQVDQTKIASITTFGSPRFLDAAGAARCASLPLACVEHVKDPISQPPPTVPSEIKLPANLTLSLPQPLSSRHLHLLVPRSEFLGFTIQNHTCLVGQEAVDERNEGGAPKLGPVRLPALPSAPNLDFHRMNSYVEILASLSGRVDSQFAVHNLLTQ